jgi:carbon-monoxide dehydrogenase small subunit
MLLKFSANGAPVEVEVSASSRLLDVLRTQLGLTGTKEGCAEGECGACTVLLDGLAVNACLVLAAQVQGRSVQTIEGLAQGAGLQLLQQNFVLHGAIQCGFCTPGMLMSATALLQEQPRPTAAQVRAALAGNLCRCTGYSAIVAAVLETANGKPPQHDAN